MKTRIFEGTMTALSSISHIGEVHGINAKLRREKIVQPDGTVEMVPVISGNSIRGILRDRGMEHMLQCLGYGNGEGLGLAAFYFLFSGGALTKSSRGLDIDEARQWCGLIPLVGVFGGAMGNQIMQGKLKVGKALPICTETAHVIPDRFVGDGIQSVWDLCQEEAYTRRDDEKNEHLRQLISPDVRGILEAKAGETRQKAKAGDDVVEATGQKQQMRYFVETLAAGTRFYWEIVLDDVTELEFEAFCVTLAQFSRTPYIGGKSGVGHGKVSVTFDNWMEIDPRAAPTGTEIDVTLGTRYMQHLEQNAAEIRGLLDGLE